MEENKRHTEPVAAAPAYAHMEIVPADVPEHEHDPLMLNRSPHDPLRQPLLRKSPTLTASHLALVGVKVSHIESLDYEINESHLFKDDWRSRSTNQVLQYVFLKWTLAFLVGLLTGVTASFINMAIENIAGYKMLYLSRLVKNERYIVGYAYLTGINFGLTMVAATLVVLYAPTAAGPGIPEIKAYLNGIDTPNMFGAATLIVKIIGSIGAVSSGLDLGKEGPLVHIGACFASLLGQGGPTNYQLKWKWLRYFKNDRDRRDLITCGASSGVCAAFRSPIGGVLFALEEVATWWRSALLWRSFCSSAVVVVVLRGFIELCKSGKCGLFGRGGLILFDVSEVTVSYHVTDVFLVVLVGIIGGLVGSFYNYALHKVLRFYSLINEKGKLAKLLLSLAVSLFTTTCLYLLPFLVPCTPCDPSLGTTCPTPEGAGNFKQFNCPDGYYNDLASLLHATNDDAVRNVFSISTTNEFRPISLIIFFGHYWILGLITFGIAVPSGLFLPIILMGSAYGRLLGQVMAKFTYIDQGLYSVLGAAALMSGSMRMTVSLCVIFLELTNNLRLLPMTMLVLLISKTVGDYFNPSIYEIILELKGLPFLEADPEPWMRNLKVKELAERKSNVIYFQGVERVSRIVDALKSTSHNGFPVLEGETTNGKANLHGVILRSHLIVVLRKKGFSPGPRITKESEVREKFTPADLAEKGEKVEDIDITEEEKNMYIDLHPFTNTTPYTVVETMSVAKAAVLFRKVGLRHLLIIPKDPSTRTSPIVGILTRQDLRAENIHKAFPHVAD